ENSAINEVVDVLGYESDLSPLATSVWRENLDLLDQSDATIADSVDSAEADDDDNDNNDDAGETMIDAHDNSTLKMKIL
ncbi:MAG: hypothetical protein Q9175_007755, partial [Cornicularia normoerica]